MPLCTSCAQPTPYLYTIYQSAHNIRLEKCPSCHEFADPYVQHDTITLLLDLILLKRDVYRHLLFNRGTGARIGVENIVDEQRQTRNDDEGDTRGLIKPEAQARWSHISLLGLALVSVDAFVRWTHLNFDSGAFGFTRGSRDELLLYLRVLLGCFIETLAYHAAITAASFVVLTGLDWFWPRRRSSAISGIRQQFRFSYIPLSIFYSSSTKFVLLLLLSIWRPSTAPSTNMFSEKMNGTVFQYPIIIAALELFDDDKLDKEWVVRNVLGGMAAGFGLRVVMDCHPIFTTLIILFGWSVKTSVARYVSEWVGGDQIIGEIWLTFSIP